MDPSPLQPLDNPQLEIRPAVYPSNVLRLFVEGLGGRCENQILDLGPVCGDNINFFAKRVRRLYICDMFFHLNQDRSRGLPPSEVWRYLDYPPQNFHGILLWNLIDHLDNQQVRGLTELCHRMTKPGGMILVFLMGEPAGRSVVNRFVIGDDFRVHIRYEPTLDLPQYARENREVLAMLAPFTPLKSFLYYNGVREFLFERD